MERLRVDGKFFRQGPRRVFLRMVTYGPFPGGFPSDPSDEFSRIRRAGFEALRLYQWPDRHLLDAAAAAGLSVFAGLEWPHAVDFSRTDDLEKARVSMIQGLAAEGGHPALAGVFIANEVPADLARWMGPGWLREKLEQLIALGKLHRPELLWCYGNYPGTEYLEPANADFTAMNVYLEDEGSFRSYLQRLHHLAGDRPVLISEFGLDSRRNGTERQAEALEWGIRASREAGTAGIAIYAWSDRWKNAGSEVLDWDFGLIDREHRDKPALSAVKAAFDAGSPPEPPAPGISVIVCSRNGSQRIPDCLRAISKLRGPSFETIVVDDGSEDDTSDIVSNNFPDVKLVRLEPSGLSAARNAGVDAASGEILAFTDDDCEPDADWLVGLAACFAEGWSAAGGPNLPPAAGDRIEAVVAAAPGSASHVMLDDQESEHVPGCNLAVRREAYLDIGGFDPLFRTAGDDVDFCWRLRDAGYRIGFAPTAFVWHRRRPSLAGYLRQQGGYGRAEALLMEKHPRRFSPSGDAIWRGIIYSGGPVRVAGDAVIYHGSMGLAGYQGVIERIQPLRDLDPGYDGLGNRALLGLMSWLAPRVRSWTRIRRFRGPLKRRPEAPTQPDAELAWWSGEDRENVLRALLAEGWQAGGSTDDWDLSMEGTRLLIATEHGKDGHKRTLVRVWGKPGLIRGIEQARPL